MRHALAFLLILAAASPVAAQSCATMGGQLDCGAAPPRKGTQWLRASRSAPDVEVHGSAEATVSSGGGSSSTVNQKVIDSHGMMEFGLRSTNTRCRHPGYGALCD